MGRPTLTRLIAGFALIALVGVACSSNSGGGSSGGFKGVSLTGAGATFPNPIYSSWFKSFHDSVESGAAVNYQSIGSGGGITQITAKTVDFGASDAPLKADESSAAPGLLQIPTVMGADVLAYNVSGVDKGLKLTPDAVAGIFLGKITKWNDPAIAGKNPGITLPSSKITVVHRTDESGTTFIFTSYLTKVSNEWSTKVGKGKAVSWPVGLGGDGNDGVAAKIKQTEGSIGYVELAYALSNNITYASVAGPSGDFIEPSVESVSAAGGGLAFPISPDTNILASSATGAYPISSATYLLVYKDQTDNDKAQTLVDLIYWCVHKGDDLAKGLNYAPLPDSIKTQVDTLLGQITVNGAAVTVSSGVK
jgi:phosphate transport system substrate-binding protein